LCYHANKQTDKQTKGGQNRTQPKVVEATNVSFVRRWGKLNEREKH